MKSSLLLLTAILFTLSSRIEMSELGTDEDFDVDYTWFTSNSSLLGKITGGNKTQQLINEQRHKMVALIVRNQLKKEMRKLKSSMTDAVLEEVINYYGKRLDAADALKTEVETLSKRMTMLSHNLNTLGQNFKTISKSHRNLVDLVRNNMAAQKSSTASPIMTKSNSGGSNLKKKSVDSLLIHSNGSNIPSEASTKLKQELINDLETKYSNLLNEKLVEIIMKNFKSNESNSNSNSEAGVNKAATKIDEIKSSDCQDLRNEGFTKDGIYKITLADNKSFNVYCEFRDKLGWTVLQRRFDGSVDFYQNWNAYKKGFGNLLSDGEFWLGLENMHDLTRQRNYSLQIVMTDWKNDEYIVEYGLFRVDSEANKYKLELGAYLSNKSTAGDSLGGGSNSGLSGSQNGNNANPTNAGVAESQQPSHNHMPFSTFDSDNDMRFYDNCAQIFKSGWWFNACFQANLNGLYYKYAPTAAGNKSPRLVKKEENAQLKFLRNGIHWNSIDFYKSLKSTKLRIKWAFIE